MFQIPSYSLIPQNQVPPSHLLVPPASERLAFPHVPDSPETLPHMAAELQATPTHRFNPVQTQPLHLLLPPVNPPHLNRPQMTSPIRPHPYVTSGLEPQPHLISPPFSPSPAELAPPPHQVYSQNHDSDWNRSSELSPHWRSDTSYQNQNHFNSSLVHLRDQPACAHRLSSNTQTPATSAGYQQPDALCPVPDPCRSLEATLSQLQCSPEASTSVEDHLGRWGLMDFSSSLTEEAFSIQYYHNAAPQPFCSPTTPGPSPQYPQTPSLSSPPMQSWEETRNVYPQTSAQLGSPSLLEYESYHSQHHPQQTNPLLTGLYELLQDQTGLFDDGLLPQVLSQEVSSTCPSPRRPANMSWRDGHGRAAGRCPSDVPWGSEGTDAAKKYPQPKKNAENPVCRLVCMMCKRDFRSLPALNGHMRSHSGVRSACVSKNEDRSVSPSASMVMPVSVPVHSKGRVQKKVSCVFPASRKALLYQSLLREDAFTSDGVSARHYTPPPMLCPVRVGPGLYCSLTSRRLKRAHAIQLHNTPDDHVVMETDSSPGTLRKGANQPQINVGRSFQAEIPLLQEKKHSVADSHNALKLWSAWEELDLPVNHQRVEALLMMARSSVVPAGGASPESALHMLTQCRGDFVLTVEKLLSPPGNHDGSNHADGQHKQVRWSEAEKRSLVKSLQLHRKDFARIQKAVQTKSVPECVEFYYLWKKKMNPTTRGLSINSEACFYFNTAQQSEVDQRLDLKFCATVEFLYRYLIQSFRLKVTKSMWDEDS